MRTRPPLFEWSSVPPRRWLLALCAGLSWCVLPSAGASAAGEPASTLAWQWLSLERDCFGCPSGQRLLLRRDGSVVATQVGKARHGTQDEARSSQVAPAEFQALMRLLEQRGFMAMPEAYQLGDTQDGAWTTLEAAYIGPAGEKTKTVFARDEAAPPELRGLWSAIDALQARAGLATPPR